ncbi:hypothetical protein JCM5296_003186, partial [Sporobolomyces johnsonii]
MPSSSLSNHDQSPRSSSSTPHPPFKPPVTHFLALNLVTPSSRPQLLTSLAELKDAIEGSSDVFPRPIGTLHLTLGVMSLLTKEEIEQAAEHLRSLDWLGMLSALPPSSSYPDSAETEPLPSTSTSNGALTLTLASLVPMHKPSSTSVLYVAPRDPTSRLETLLRRPPRVLHSNRTPPPRDSPAQAARDGRQPELVCFFPAR